MRDLVALSTLPAVWIGLSADGVARSLADAVLGTLSLDLVYVRLASVHKSDAVEVFRSKDQPSAMRPSDMDAMRAALAGFASGDQVSPDATIAHPFGGPALRIAVTRFGVADDHGLLITASRDSDFPTEQQRLLLGVAANQAATVIRRQRADEQLHDRQEWLDVTLRSIGDAVVATDVGGRVVFLNAVASQLTGWTPDEATGKPIDSVFVIVDEHSLQPVENPIARALRDGTVVGAAHAAILVAKDGRRRPIDDAAAPIRNHAGKLIGAVLTFRDVSEQRRAEQLLRQSDARKSAILDTALDCIISMDHEGNVVEWNPAAERTFGYRRADVIGRALAELIIPSRLRERHLQGVAHYLRTGEGPALGQRIELPALRADGTELTVEASIARIPIPGPPLFTAYLRDISERKRNERNRNLRLLVTQALAEARDISDAALRVLHAVCESLGWEVGIFWTVAPAAEELHFFREWHAHGASCGALMAASRARTFRRGEGLPGEAWARGQPVWLPDVAEASNFPRAASAAAEGLHAAFACPLLLGSKSLGVIEFFSRHIHEPDGDLLETMATVASVIVQYVERKQAEEALRRSEARFRGLMEQAPFSIQVFATDGRTIDVNRAWEQLWDVKLAQIGDYNILEDKQLEARGVLQYIQQGFAGRTARIPAIEYNPNETIPNITQSEDPRRFLSAVIYPLKDVDGAVQEVVLIHEDVSARKRAEEALRESRERLDLALQAADLGHWVLSLADGTTTQNQRCDEIFGYDQTQPWTYAKFLNHVVSDDREFVDAGFQEAVRNDTPWDCECRIRTADGALRWIWLRGRAFKHDDGLARRMAGTVADITVRKEIEEELRHARARLQAALDAGAIATWTWDIPNNRMFADEALARLFGLEPSYAEGGLLDRYVASIHPDDRSRVMESLSQAVETGETYEADYRVIQPDGAMRWVVARGRADRDAMGRPVRMPGVLVDITERKRLEQELQIRVDQLADADRRREELLATLQQSEEKLRLLADTIPQLAWMAQPDGAIFWFNRRWYEYTGTTPDEVKGWSWQSVHDPEVLPSVLERWKASVVSGQPFDMVFPLRGADGAFRPFLTRVNPLRDASGRILYWFGTNTDISEIKRMEEALKDTDRRKDEFLATLAHELRNPLAPIRTALQILKTPRVDAATAQRSRDIMERQVEQLVRLVDDLLDVSRVMRGKIDLRKEHVELATVVARGVETAQPLIEAHGHQLEISLPAESLKLDADPMRLAQVIGNLLTNAAKYTEQGGHITLSARRVGNNASISIRDDGIGIDADSLRHIFDLFVQVHHSTRRPQAGLGIGLTLVKSLVELHGGTIAASSGGLGKGSEFVVTLPLAPSAALVPGDGERDVQAQASTSNSHRVLVVDDNTDAATSLAELLALNGHVVRVAHDGKTALAMMKEFSPALILLDIGMPDMDGYEVAVELRKTPAGRSAVLAALTGWGQETDRRRSAAAGFDQHLVKPLDPGALASLLASLKREHHA